MTFCFKEVGPYMKARNCTSYMGLGTRILDNKGMGTDFLERRNVGIVWKAQES